MSTPSTRDRLLDAAVRLFAERGFRRTTVGDIEEAAGFAARGGTLYKHFASKEDLLAAVVDREAEQVAGPRAVADLLPLGDVRAETTLVYRYLFAELARYRDVTALIEKEGAAAPELADRFWSAIADPGYRLGAKALDRQLNGEEPGGWDTDALAAVLMGAVTNARRSQWTFATTPLDVSEERMVQVIAQVVEVLARS